MAKVAAFTAENWEQEVLRSPQPVLVDFRASWCPLGESQAEMLEQIAGEHGPELLAGFLEVPKFVKMSLIHQIKDLPAIALFYEGKILMSFSGAKRVRSMKDHLLRSDLFSFAKRST